MSDEAFSSGSHPFSPTLTHSHRLDLYEVMGWFPKTSEGIAKAFAYGHMEFQPLWASVDDSFELVGYWIDHRVVEKIPYHPLFVNFTFFFRANKPLTEPYWLISCSSLQKKDSVAHWQ